MRASDMRDWHFWQRSRRSASSGIAAGKSAIVLHLRSGGSARLSVTGKSQGRCGDDSIYALALHGAVRYCSISGLDGAGAPVSPLREFDG